ncbi:MAG: hypothetical protein ABI697_05755 [Devosia sp.]
MTTHETWSTWTAAAAALLRSNKSLVAAAAVATLAIGAATAVSAAASPPITPDSVNHWQHVIDCANALINDPAAHAKYCNPGHDVFVNGTAGTATSSSD